MKHLKVNPHNYQWIFNPSKRCKRDQTRFLVLIKSKEENYQVRHTIRDTWCTREGILPIDNEFLLGLYIDLVEFSSVLYPLKVRMERPVCSWLAEIIL